MLFRKAWACDAERIGQLYDDAKRSPMCTWPQEYPNRFDIDTDTAAGTLYILEEDGEVIAAASIVPENEMEEYECWSHAERPMELARVCVKRSRQGKGLSEILCEMMLSEMQTRGADAVRLSVSKTNIPAQKTYLRLGFTVKSEIHIYGQDMYLCEKQL